MSKSTDFRSSFIAVVVAAVNNKKGLVEASNTKTRTNKIKVCTPHDILALTSKYNNPTLISEIGEGGALVMMIEGYTTLFVVNSRTAFGSINPLNVVREIGGIKDHVEVVPFTSVNDAVNDSMTVAKKKAQAKLGLNGSMRASYGRGMKTSNIMARVDKAHNRMIHLATSNEVSFEKRMEMDSTTFLAGCEYFIKFYRNNPTKAFDTAAVDVVLAFKGMMYWYDAPKFDAINVLIDCMDSLVILDGAEMDNCNIEEMLTGTLTIDSIIRESASPSEAIRKVITKIVRKYTNGGYTFSNGAEANALELSWIEDMGIDELVKVGLIYENEISEETPDIDMLTTMALQRGMSDVMDDIKATADFVTSSVMIASAFIDAAMNA